MTLFFFFGLSIAIFLFLLILVKRNKNNADYILAIWMGYMTVHLTFFLLDYSKFSYEHPHLLGILLPFPILHGFFLYSYTLQTTTNRFFSAKVLSLHLTPFLLLVILAVPFYSLPAAAKLQVFQNQGRGFEWNSAVQMGLFVTVCLTYSTVSILAIKRHRRQMLNLFSNNDRKKLVWLEWMSLGLGAIWVLAFSFDDTVIFSGVVLFILFIGVFGITQTPVFFTTVQEERLIDESTTTQGEQGQEKYQKSGLTPEETARLSDLLETYMQQNKPYKNPDLTLDELAALVKINPNQLSQVINSRAGKTFYHYINSYRIREFLALAALPESRKFTYMGLAYDCGFQSKTTFNKYFKM
ncbi:MAG TPA: helix-turn-helix domain-containing protein [Chryseosolibacter sp.]